MTPRLFRQLGRLASPEKSRPSVFFVPADLRRRLWRRAFGVWLARPWNILIIGLLWASAAALSILVVHLVPILKAGQPVVTLLLFVGGVSGYGLLARRTIAGYVRRELARMPDRCSECGYLIQDSSQCPECGSVRKPATEGEVAESGRAGRIVERDSERSP